MKTLRLIQKRIIQIKKLGYEPKRIWFTFASWNEFRKENDNVISYSVFPDMPIAQVLGLDVEIYATMPCDFIIEDEDQRGLFGGRRI